MILFPLYQATRKTANSNNETIASPILSTRNTWLGEGYYFWDGFMELPHWWGQVHYNNSYTINEAQVEVDDSDYFDLVGSTSNMQEFASAYQSLRSLFPEENITIKAVLAVMKSSGIYSFKVIRARTEHKIPGSERIRFMYPDRSYMLTIPAIQLCVQDISCIKQYRKIFETE